MQIQRVEAVYSLIKTFSSKLVYAEYRGQRWPTCSALHKRAVVSPYAGIILVRLSGMISASNEAPRKFRR